MKWVFFSLVFTLAGAFLARERAIASALRADLEAQRSDRAEMEAQRRERERLVALQPTPDELARLQHAAAQRSERQHAIEAAGRERRAAAAPGIRIGEWLPPSQWEDRGQGTPIATVQTMLWAAAGGDTARLEAMLHCDDDVRAKLAQIYAKLPANDRAKYASPEQLIAAFTAKAIPLGDAQLVWQQQTGPDDAVACVWVDNPAPASASETSEKIAAGPKTPPMSPADPKRSQALLTMKRSDEGWRIIVPMSAIDSLARQLGLAK